MLLLLLGGTTGGSPLDVAYESGSTHDRALRHALVANRRWSYEQYGQWPVIHEDASLLETTEIASPLDVSTGPGSAYNRALLSAQARRRDGATNAIYTQWPVLREDATALGTVDIVSPNDRALRGPLAARRYGEQNAIYAQWPVVRKDATPLGTTDVVSPDDVATGPGSTYDRALKHALVSLRDPTGTRFQFRQRPVQPTRDNSTLGTTDIDTPLDTSYAPGGTRDRQSRSPLVPSRVNPAQYAQRRVAGDTTPASITGTLAVTLGALTSAADGASGASGTLASTLGALSSAADGASGASGTLSVTLGAVSSAASGSEVTGVLAQTLGAVTSAAAGTVGDTSTLDVTLGAVTSAASGGVGASGTLAVTLGAVTSAASGSSVTGTVAQTLANTTSAATGASGAAGTLDITLGDVTSSSGGGAGTDGSLAVTLGATTCAASGTFTPPTVTGTLDVTLGELTSAAAGTHTAPSGGGGGYPSFHRRPSLLSPREPTGRTVSLKLTANLGGVTAHANASIEFADEEILALL